MTDDQKQRSKEEQLNNFVEAIIKKHGDGEAALFAVAEKYFEQVGYVEKYEKFIRSEGMAGESIINEKEKG